MTDLTIEILGNASLGSMFSMAAENSILSKSSFHINLYKVHIDDIMIFKCRKYKHWSKIFCKVTKQLQLIWLACALLRLVWNLCMTLEPNWWMFRVFFLETTETGPWVRNMRRQSWTPTRFSHLCSNRFVVDSREYVLNYPLWL